MLAFFTVCAVLATATAERKHELLDGKTEIISLAPHEAVQFHTETRSPQTNYVLFQAHSQRAVLNVSSTEDWAPGQSTSGTSVGLVTLLSVNQTTASWFLQSTANITVRVLVVSTAYSQYAPVAGGCNLEFPLEDDPNLHVQQDNSYHTVGFAWAALPYARTQPPSDCETKQKGLHYELYVRYMEGGNLEESYYLTELQKVLQTKDIPHYARHVRSFGFHDKTQKGVASFPRRGAIYTAVVTYTDDMGNMTRVAYVPYVTYSCSWQDGKDSCTNSRDGSEMAFVIIMSIFGFFICFFGHRFFKCSVFYFGFIAFALVSYILLTRFTSLPPDGLIWLGATLGVIGGSIWLVFWSLVGIPIFIVLLSSLVFGFLFSSLIFAYTPLDSLGLMQVPFNYGMSFACGVLLIPVFFLAATHKLSIVCCAVGGAYWPTMAVCLALDATLIHAFLHSLHKACIHGFISVSVIMPLDYQDLALLSLWVIMATLGSAFQMYREKGRPQFPICPYDVYKGLHDLQVPINSSDNSGYESFSERSPLLPHNPPPQRQPLVDPI